MARPKPWEVKRPDVVLADRGYDHDKYRRPVRELGIRPLIARRNTEHGSGLGTQRWVVERAFALLHHFRLGCAFICWRRLASLRQEF